MSFFLFIIPHTLNPPDISIKIIRRMTRHHCIPVDVAENRPIRLSQAKELDIARKREREREGRQSSEVCV